MGDFDNDGAMMDVDETLMCKFIKVKCDNKKGTGLVKKGTNISERGSAGKRGGYKSGFGMF
jgi:hypothetical protein